MKRMICIFGIFVLLCLLFAACGEEQAAPVPAETPTVTEATPAPANTPLPTPAPSPEPTPMPEKNYTLSFAGDCTLGSLVEWQGSHPGDFQSVVGEDYAYPFSGVASLFQSDDFTMVNLEGPLSEGGTPRTKKYRFRGSPEYTGILTSGSVEAVSLANNHSLDLGGEGIADTRDALAAAGVGYAEAASPLIVELEGGLRLGIVAYNTVESMETPQTWKDEIMQDVAACREAGCHAIIGFLHWGLMEYRSAPDIQVTELAHAMADGGCDLIVGGHAHILQPMEAYNGVPIAYSMGNFCFGGNSSPEDRDSVVLQAELCFDPNTESAALTALRAVPCQISSTAGRNDYCPRICTPEEEAWTRIFTRLQWPETGWSAE